MSAAVTYSLRRLRAATGAELPPALWLDPIHADRGEQVCSGTDPVDHTGAEAVAESTAGPEPRWRCSPVRTCA
ncbi:hypothetical protein [Tsukamurella soli]|uniref:Uncharacterized protein n=1 Tax=Tsukamurella soli TaxID=644556 RepID=A0ABP8KK24_9ACTN